MIKTRWLRGLVHAPRSLATRPVHVVVQVEAPDVLAVLEGNVDLFVGPCCLADPCDDPFEPFSLVGLARCQDSVEHLDLVAHLHGAQRWVVVFLAVTSLELCRNSLEERQKRHGFVYVSSSTRLFISNFSKCKGVSKRSFTS